jgi:hypothetical protein
MMDINEVYMLLGQPDTAQVKPGKPDIRYQISDIRFVILIYQPIKIWISPPIYHNTHTSITPLGLSSLSHTHTHTHT